MKALTAEREANDSGNGGIVSKQETGSASPGERAERRLRLLYSSWNHRGSRVISAGINHFYLKLMKIWSGETGLVPHMMGSVPRGSFAQFVLQFLSDTEELLRQEPAEGRGKHQRGNIMLFNFIKTNGAGNGI